MQTTLPSDGTSRKHLLLLVLFSMLCLASLYFERNIGGGGIKMPYTYTIWLVASFIIAAGFYFTGTARRIYLPRYWLWIIAMPAGFMLSGFISETQRPVEWAIRIAFLLGGFLFFFTLFQFRINRRTINNLLYIFMLAAFLHALAGLIQMQGGTWWSGWIPYTRGVPHGIFQQKNMVASLAATGVVIALYLMTVPGFRAASPVYRIPLFLSLFICSAAVFFTSSRVGLLGASLALVVLVLGRYRFLLKNRLMLLLGVFAILFGSWFGSQGLDNVSTKVARDGYENARVVVYKLSWDLFTEKPLFGHGLGSYFKVFQEKRIEFQRDHPEAGSAKTGYSHPHNEVLFWLVESGLVSVIGMLLAALATVWQLVRLGRQRGLAYLALLLPISLHVMVELPFYLSSFHWFLWLFLLFIVYSHFSVSYSNRLSGAARIALPVLGVVLALIVAIFSVHSILSLRGLTQFVMESGKDKSRLQTIESNPVLSELGAVLLYRRLLYEDLAGGGFRHVRNYIAWAEQHIQHSPRDLVLMDLAFAYEHVGDQQNARNIIDRAVAMYNKNEELAACKQYIDRGRGIDYFRLTRARRTGKSTQPVDRPVSGQQTVKP